jgi:hypothetical protein
LRLFAVGSFVCGSLSLVVLLCVLAQFFHCVDVNGLGRVLFNYPSISCDGDQYRQLYPVFVLVALVFVAGFPAAMFLVLLRNQRRGLLRNPDHLRKFGNLFAPYEPRYFYWQTAVLVRCVSVSVSINRRLSLTLLCSCNVQAHRAWCHGRAHHGSNHQVQMVSQGKGARSTLWR